MTGAVEAGGHDVQLNYFDRDVLNRELSMGLTNGMEVVIDDVTGRIYITKGQQQFNISLYQAILHSADGNVAVANQRRASIHESLSEIGNSARLQPHSFGNYSTHSSSKSSGVLGIWNAPNHPFPSPPAGYVIDHASVYFPNSGMYDMQFQRAENWDQDGTTNEPAPGTDEWYWNHEREEACDRIDNDVAAYGAALTLEIVACVGALDSGGLLIVACGAAATNAMLVGDALTDDVQLCNSVYPGPGKW